jgi:hypothetical protein
MARRKKKKPNPNVASARDIRGQLGALFLVFGVFLPFASYGNASLMSLGNFLASLLLAIALTYLWCMATRDDNRIWALGLLALTLTLSYLSLAWLALPRAHTPQGISFPFSFGAIPLLLGSSLMAWSRPTSNLLEPLRSPKATLWASSLYVLAGWAICQILLLVYLCSIPPVRRELKGAEDMAWFLATFVVVISLTLLFVGFPHARAWRILERPLPKRAYIILIVPTLGFALWLIFNRQMEQLLLLGIGVYVMLLGVLTGLSGNACRVIAACGNIAVLAASAVLALLARDPQLRVLLIHVSLGTALVLYILWHRPSDLGPTLGQGPPSA